MQYIYFKSSLPHGVCTQVRDVGDPVHWLQLPSVSRPSPDRLATTPKHKRPMGLREFPAYSPTTIPFAPMPMRGLPLDPAANPLMSILRGMMLGWAILFYSTNRGYLHVTTWFGLGTEPSFQTNVAEFENHIGAVALENVEQPGLTDEVEADIVAAHDALQDIVVAPVPLLKSLLEAGNHIP